MRSARCLLVLCAGLLAVEARACSIPVFRYALERWAPSSYEVFVFHRGPLDAFSAQLVSQLKQSAQSANLAPTVADVSGKLAPRVAAVWRQAGRPTARPQLVVLFPDEEDNASPLWSVPLDEASVRQLLDSPLRRRIVSLLTQGESVVWLLLTSGDPRAEEATSRLLERELARLSDVLKLPEQAGADPELRSSVPLRISFPVVRLSRDQAEESFLVRTLLNSEEGLAKVAGPIVFPIFGRGRVLMALHGEQVTPTHIERWASFLCGACSCRVKEANPGVDLLIAADWEELLETLGDRASAPKKPAITAPPIPPGSTGRQEDVSAEEPAPHTCHCWLWGSLSAIGVVAAAVGGWRLHSRFVRRRYVFPSTASTTQQPR
jgi:hypothetical protein